MPERLTAEQRARLEAMTKPGQKKWDLSPNDEAAIRAALAEIDALRTYFCPNHLPAVPNDIREHVPCVQCLADWLEKKCEEIAVDRDRLRELAKRYSEQLRSRERDTVDHVRRLKEINGETTTNS